MTKTKVLLTVWLLLFVCAAFAALPPTPKKPLAPENITKALQGPEIVFHVKSSAGWSLKGAAPWPFFVALIRGVMQKGETIEILTLHPMREPK